MKALKLTTALVALMAGVGVAQAGSLTVNGASVDPAATGNTQVDTLTARFNPIAAAINDNDQRVSDLETSAHMIFGETGMDLAARNSAMVQESHLKTQLSATPANSNYKALQDYADSLPAGDAVKTQIDTYLSDVSAYVAAGGVGTKPVKPNITLPTNEEANLNGVSDEVDTWKQTFDGIQTYTTKLEGKFKATADTAGASAQQLASDILNADGSNSANLLENVVTSFNNVDAKIGDINTLADDIKAGVTGDLTVVKGINAVNEKIGDLDDINNTANDYFKHASGDSLVDVLNGADERIRTAHTNFDNRISANEAAISSNTSRIVSLEEDVDELKSGVAMAIAIANAPVLEGGQNGFSLSGGFGNFKGQSAGSLKAAFLPMPNMAITASVATDFDDNVSAGAGLGFAF